jgi:hypothetical protein
LNLLRDEIGHRLQFDQKQLRRLQGVERTRAVYQNVWQLLLCHRTSFLDGEVYGFSRYAHVTLAALIIRYDALKPRASAKSRRDRWPVYPTDDLVAEAMIVAVMRSAQR